MKEQKRGKMAKSAYEAYGPRGIRFTDSALPSANDFPYPNITLPRETIELFRDRFYLLLELAEDVLGKDRRDICLVDLLKYYSKKVAL